MPATYTPISTTTLGSSTNSVTFSSIPSTYTDLVLVWTAACDAGVLQRVQFNSDSTTSNYSSAMIYAATTARYSDSWIYNLAVTVNGLNGGQLFLNDYTSTSKYKTSLSQFGEYGLGVYYATQTWRNTSAVTSITLQTSSNNYVSGSIFTLYGIKAAS
jgi:hypothetical protein